MMTPQKVSYELLSKRRAFYLNLEMLFIGGILRFTWTGSDNVAST